MAYDEESVNPPNTNRGDNAARLDGGASDSTDDNPIYRFRGSAPPAALAYLRDTRRWVAWRYVKRDGKWTKPPINPNATDADVSDAASVADPATWGTFDQALAYLSRYPAMAGGIGIVLTKEDDLSGIDLDDCISDSGSFSPLAAEIIGYGETYAERSPSGNGLRMFVKGKAARTLKVDSVGVEVYNAGRYLTVTCDAVEDMPAAVQPAPRTLARLETERPPERARPKANGANGAAKPASGDFWRNVSDAALDRLDDWVPTLQALGPPSVQRPALVSYTTPGDANPEIANEAATLVLLHVSMRRHVAPAALNHSSIAAWWWDSLARAIIGNSCKARGPRRRRGRFSIGLAIHANSTRPSEIDEKRWPRDLPGASTRSSDPSSLLEKVGLWRLADERARALSGGQKKLLELSRALMLDPKLILLDGPAASVSPPMRVEISHVIRGLCDEGLTFVVVEHDSLPSDPAERVQYLRSCLQLCAEATGGWLGVARNGARASRRHGLDPVHGIGAIARPLRLEVAGDTVGLLVDAAALQPTRPPLLERAPRGPRAFRFQIPKSG
jgi:hypothetical protein